MSNKDKMEAIGASQLNLGTCTHLSRLGEPFVITHGRGEVPFFVAFPVAMEDGEVGPGSAQLIHDYARDWGAECPDAHGE